jgi:hypothetical protein
MLSNFARTFCRWCAGTRICIDDVQIPRPPVSIMYPELTEIDLLSARLASIRQDISRRLWLVDTGVRTPAYEALIDRMSQLQYSSERRVG